MSSKQVIAVVGATGNQGGSVVRSLLLKPQFTVRALTRNASAPKAKELEKQGCQVVQCDVEKAEDLEKAFAGAYGVFGVTTMDPGNPPMSEFNQGKRIVDAAAKNKVQHLVLSSLDDIEKIDKSLHVHHFTEKNKVEEYAKSLKVFPLTTFVYPGYFLSNFNFWMTPKKDAEGKWVVEGNVKPDVKLPFVDINEDTGPLVAEVFANPKAYGNATRINVAREYGSVNDLWDKIEKLTGQKIHYKYTEPPQNTGNEMVDMVNLFNKYGYYKKGSDDLSLAKKINPNMGDIEEWLKRIKYHPDNFAKK